MLGSTKLIRLAMLEPENSDQVDLEMTTRYMPYVGMDIDQAAFAKLGRRQPCDDRLHGECGCFDGV